MRLQRVELLGRQVGLGLEVVVVVLRDRQQAHAVRLELRHGRQKVVGGEGDVLHARAEQLREEARGLRALALRGVEHDAQAAVGATRPPGSAPGRPDRRRPAAASSRGRAARCRTAARSASPRTASTARCDRRRCRPASLRAVLAGRRRTRCPRPGRARSSDRGSRPGCRRRRAPPGCRARPARRPGGTARRAAAWRARRWPPHRRRVGRARRPPSRA